MKAASTESGIGRCVRKIADAVMKVERRGGGGLPIHSAHIKRPPCLLQPRSNIDLELVLILFGDSPARHVSIEIILQHLGSGDPLDGDPVIGSTGHSPRFPDQRNVESGLKKPQSCHFASQACAVMSRDHLKRRFNPVIAVPANERLDVTLMPSAQTDDTRKRRQSRHQSNSRVVYPSEIDADWVPGKAL